MYVCLLSFSFLRVKVTRVTSYACMPAQRVLNIIYDASMPARKSDLGPVVCAHAHKTSTRLSYNEFSVAQNSLRMHDG